MTKTDHFLQIRKRQDKLHALAKSLGDTSQAGMNIRKMILLFLEAADLGKKQNGELDKTQLWDLCTDAALVGYFIAQDATEDGGMGEDFDEELTEHLEKIVEVYKNHGN